MSEHLPLSQPDKSVRVHKQVVYEPPSLTTVNQYARQVCQKLATHTPKHSPDPAFRRDFAAFVRAVVSIQTKYLNKGGI
jgi:hypothetical protein